MRLLALQSASRRWQQKEQQVMKESKEKLNRVKTTPDHYRVTTRSASTGRGHPGTGVKGLEKGKPPSRPGTERSKAPPKGHAAKHTLSPGTTVSLISIEYLHIISSSDKTSQLVKTDSTARRNLLINKMFYMFRERKLPALRLEL